MATVYRVFSRGVLTTAAVGYIACEVPALPVFYSELRLEPDDDINSAEARVDYAKVGESFLVDLLSVDRGQRGR